jgi:transposase-like protein
MSHFNQDPMTGEANPRLSTVQELRDENIRLRQENYRLQKALTLLEAVVESEDLSYEPH